MMDGLTGQIELTPTEQKVLGQLVLDHAGIVRLTYEETIANLSELRFLLPASSAGKLFLHAGRDIWRSRLHHQQSIGLPAWNILEPEEDG